MSTMRGKETTLAREALFRDHGRFHLSDDAGERNRIKGRMIDTVMDLEAVGAAEALLIVNRILAQDPSAPSQLKIGVNS